MGFHSIRHLAESVTLRLLVCVMQMFSPRQTAFLCRLFAAFIRRALPEKLTRTAVVRENLRLSFPEKSAAEIETIIDGMWVHLFRLLAEIAQLPRRLSLQRIYDVLEFRNRPDVLGALSSGRPVLLLSGHVGNWEMAVATFGIFGFPMGVVARDLDNPRLNDWMRQFRSHTGHTLLSKKGDYEKILKQLEQNNHLALLGDQDAGAHGQFVEFFGRPASTFKSIALLSLQYEALIVVGYARRLPDDFENYPWFRFELGCEEVIDPLTIDSMNPVWEITQRYTLALERIIRRDPEQYLWLHRRWKSVPAKRKRRPAKAA
ncbi:MAG: lysophospholipid acyltransferase family protein [Planctomycetota bacterium]|nr:lysophospholipid acyltransferase family protein [Planctomycetota bacterium]MDA1211415.1 lysophospholipid acyltransferase family protein [Planctomycetota bacterium]